MWNLKNYKFGFDPWGLGLFLVIMLPNCIWFAVPAPNDILRAESVTPLLDTVGQVLQVVLAAGPSAADTRRGLSCASCFISPGGRPITPGPRAAP